MFFLMSAYLMSAWVNSSLSVQQILDFESNFSKMVQSYNTDGYINYFISIQ